MSIKLSSGKEIPIEMHKARMVQKISLIPVDERLKAMAEAGYNTFLLKTKDIFLDMLTDSGVNAMSDKQYGALMTVDDAYAGSMTFYDFAKAVEDVLGYKHVMNVHQGRAAEHLLAKVYAKPGGVIPTNYHFTTTRAHIELQGMQVLEIYYDEALKLYGETFRLDPMHAMAHNNAGVALKMMGRMAEAIAEFQQAVRLAPNVAGVHYNLAMVLLSEGRTVEAARHCAETLRIEPKAFAELRRHLTRQV
jgi:tetratricopeptide (TPR) repeat protein